MSAAFGLLYDLCVAGTLLTVAALVVAMMVLVWKCLTGR